MESLLQETKAPGVGKEGLVADDRSFSVTIKLRFSITDTVSLPYSRSDAPRSGML